MVNQQNATATIKSSKRFSTVWIIPLVALFSGAWMLFQYMSEQGPEISLTVNTADGIQAGKTLIKARSVKVGVITEVALNDNYDQIELTARMDSGTERMLREDTAFWLVKPRIGTEGVSGLETLLSGPYLEMRPGESKVRKTHFTMMDSPPVAPPDAKGLRVLLSSDQAGKLAIGDPVMFEGYTVGRVEKVGFDVDKKKATYQLFIFQPYDSLIRTRTRFWLNSGMDIQLNAQGFNIEVASLETLVIGGVSFAIPEGSPEGTLVTEQLHNFALYNNHKQMQEQMFESYLPYALLFNESIRGLSPGAPVEYRGVRIGTVMKVPLHLTGKDAIAKTQIPILIHIELARIYDLTAAEQTESEIAADFLNAFQKGLRASLKTGNLLSGALYVDANFYPDSEPVALNESYFGYPVFPTTEGEFMQFQRQLSSILNKIHQLPIEGTVSAVDSTMNATQNTLRTFDTVSKELANTLKTINSLLQQKETQQLPHEVNATLERLQRSLQGLSPDSRPYQELEEALLRLNRVLGQMGPLLDTLNASPDALIFGSEDQADPIPVKGHSQ